MRLPVRLFVSAFIFAASACGSSSPTGSGGNPPAGPVADVSMTDNNGSAPYAFSLDPLNIKVGTSVRWTNNGPATHTTTSDGTGWDSGQLAVNATFSHQFTSAGTFTYHSTNDAYLYPNFVGTITVTP